MSQPVILAIDTSCDETAAAVSCGRRILSNIIASQINIHKKWGGVVPHLAKRAHQEKIEPVVHEALTRARSVLNRNSRVQLKKSSPAGGRTDLNGVNAIAVTIGPGLAPALEVGLTYAKKLALKHHKPLIPINHMEGHLLSSLALNSKGGGRKGQSLMDKKTPPIFPALGLLVSGGHTQLVLTTSEVKKNTSEVNFNYQLLGETLDDAAGEALDKLAKMLKLGYPGGPIIEELAKKGDPNAIELPVPIRYSKNFNFSFSGLKTAALYKIQARERSVLAERQGRTLLNKKFTFDMAAAFQQAIAISLTTKLTRAIKEFQPQSILLGGGVFSNIYIRKRIRSAIRPFKIPVYLPYSKKLFTDNAAMICIPAYYNCNKGPTFVTNPTTLDRQPNLSF